MVTTLPDIDSGFELRPFSMETPPITNNTGAGNPFQRSTLMTRSPKNGANNKRSDFQKLGEHIRNLFEFVEDGTRRSIHQPMRDAISNIKEYYNKVAIQMKDGKATEVFKEISTQTSPWLKITMDKRKNQENETPKSKRSKKQSTEEKAKEKMQQRDNKTPMTEDSENTGASQQQSDDEVWTKVTHKKDKKIKKRTLRKPRPDAIVIAKKGEMSYADILRRVKTDPNLRSVGEAVTKIRRTQKGELLLQLKESGDGTAGYKNSILTTLAEEAEVRTLTHRTTVEVRDIDEITTKEDVEGAIKTQLGFEELPDKAVSLRKAYGETQIAAIVLPGELARKLLEAGKMKIGWTICRIRERTELKKCFRCLEFGHIAMQCKSREDRSKLCRKCGEDGHIAKDCKREPSCMFCKKEHPNDANHIAGSSKCPIFRRALKDKR